MQLNEFTEYLTNFSEILFLYRGKEYMASCFWTKPLLRKGHVEYWLFTELDDSKDSLKFKTIEELLNDKIEGRKLKDILDEIEIIVIY